MKSDSHQNKLLFAVKKSDRNLPKLISCKHDKKTPQKYYIPVIK